MSEMIMKWILIASLVLNVLLGVIMFKRSLVYHNTVRFWFIKKPDFATVESVVKTILIRPGFAEWFEFKEFTIKDPWMADIDVRWKKELTGANWHKVQDVATAVSKEVDLPCWPYKMIMNPSAPAQRIGNGFGIGYSKCEDDST